MENSSNNLAENSVEDTFSTDQQFDFVEQTSFASGPDDEEEEEEPAEEEEQDDNPPLDDEIVHSPVPTQSGGRPETAQN